MAYLLHTNHTHTYVFSYSTTQSITISMTNPKTTPPPSTPTQKQRSAIITPPATLSPHNPRLVSTQSTVYRSSIFLTTYFTLLILHSQHPNTRPVEIISSHTALLRTNLGTRSAQFHYSVNKLYPPRVYPANIHSI